MDGQNSFRMLLDGNDWETPSLNGLVWMRFRFFWALWRPFGIHRRATNCPWTVDPSICISIGNHHVGSQYQKALGNWYWWQRVTPAFSDAVYHYFTERIWKIQFGSKVFLKRSVGLYRFSLWNFFTNEFQLPMRLSRYWGIFLRPSDQIGHHFPNCP